MYFSGTHYLLFLLTYLLCAIPFGFLVVRIQKGTDVRKTGSGNIGATNVLRASGKMAGIVTLVLDAMKGALAVWGAGHFSAHNPRVVAVCAVIALLAHMFPLYLKFKGGKGVSTGLGVFLAWPPGPHWGRSESLF
jgi:acyl phosphate:glycerol-3-phosphate acyltransferase